MKSEPKPEPKAAAAKAEAKAEPKPAVKPAEAAPQKAEAKAEAKPAAKPAEPAKAEAKPAPKPAEPPAKAKPAKKPPGEALGQPPKEALYRGIPVAPGIAIGIIYDTTEPTTEAPRRAIAAEQVEAERERLNAAAATARKQVTKLKTRLAILPEEAQGELAPLLDAYVMMLGNSRLLRGAKKRIGEALLSAETAVLDESEDIAAIILNAKDDDKSGLLRRAGEVREIARRLIRHLTATPFRSFKEVPQGAILVAEELTPADAALLDPARIAGVATDDGGADGHTAIMLRALGIPSIVGCAGLTEAAKRGDFAVLDGGAGNIALHPGEATLALAKDKVAAYARERAKLSKLRRLPAETTDGEVVELQANLEIPAELPLIAQAGAQGIGLLRSEFLFLNRDSLPDENAQFDAYRSIVEAMGGDSVTIRVLDWGGEKDMEALGEGVPAPSGPNPALGLRGLRLLLKRPELLEEQFAAILRVAIRGPVRVMLPMVTIPQEVAQAREIYERVAKRLRRRGEALPEKLPPLGVMIETPGAALAADAIALEADFFSIGTNDLAMYTLAVDRAETEVSHLYDPLHPAVLRLVQFATEAALRMRMPVSVCGEMAGNPKLVPLLMGLGLRSLSMNAGSIPRVKQAVRALTIDDCARLARRVMEQSDPQRIRELVEAFAAEKL